MMNAPRMILFDYGQTLLCEQGFDGVAGTKAVLQPEEVWYIGDDYQCDVVGARNAGIFPVYYIGASKKEPMEDVLTVSTWEELEAYIENQ